MAPVRSGPSSRTGWHAGEMSTTGLGAWDATVLRWRRAAALLVTELTLLSLVMPLAPRQDPADPACGTSRHHRSDVTCPCSSPAARRVRPHVPRRDVRTAAAALHSSLEDLGQVLSAQFVSAEGRLDDILDAYAYAYAYGVDHGHRPTTS